MIIACGVKSFRIYLIETVGEKNNNEKICSWELISKIKFGDTCSLWGTHVCARGTVSFFVIITEHYEATSKEGRQEKKRVRRTSFQLEPKIVCSCGKNHNLRSYTKSWNMKRTRHLNYDETVDIWNRDKKRSNQQQKKVKEINEKFKCHLLMMVA